MVLLILDWHPLRRIRSLDTFLSAVIEKLPFAAFSLFSSIMTILAQGSAAVWLCGWAYYLATLLPVLGIVQVGDQSMADRYMYLPCLGPFLFIGLMAAWIWEKVNTLRARRLTVRILCTGGAFFALLSTSYVTYRQIGIWEDSLMLWNYVIEKEFPGPITIGVLLLARSVSPKRRFWT